MLAVMAAVIAIAFSVPAQAGEPETGISVTGIGTIKVKPNAVEISGIVSGEAELAADADVKFKDARKKAVDMFDGMKITGLTVTGEGSGLHDRVDATAQMRAMQMGGTADAQKSKVAVTEKLTITVTGIDQMPPDKVQAMVVKLLDAARQSGMQVGPPAPTNYYQMQMGSNDALVTYKVADPAAARADAYKQAVADAKSKADQLATLSGGKLGKVVSIAEQPQAAKNATFNPYFGTSEPADDPDTKPATSTTGEISLTVKLAVRYELAQ